MVKIVWMVNISKMVKIVWMVNFPKMVKIVWMVNIPKMVKMVWMVNKPIWSRLLDNQDDDAQVGQVCEDRHDAQDCHWSISSSMPGSNLILKNLATSFATLMMTMVMMMIVKDLGVDRQLVRMGYRFLVRGCKGL